MNMPVYFTTTFHPRHSVYSTPCSTSSLFIIAARVHYGSTYVSLGLQPSGTAHRKDAVQWEAQKGAFPSASLSVSTALAKAQQDAATGSNANGLQGTIKRRKKKVRFTTQGKKTINKNSNERPSCCRYIPFVIGHSAMRVVRGIRMAAISCHSPINVNIYATVF